MMKAKWIWAPNADQINTVAFFQKYIYISRQVKQVILHVSAHNHLKLNINGLQVSGYATPAPSNPEQSKFYLTYDVTDHIQYGNNQILAKVLYFGGEGQNYLDGKPGFILWGDILYTDGTKESLVSDETWMASADTPYENQTPYQQFRRITPMECYDARKRLEHISWKAAVISRSEYLGWKLTPQKIPEGGFLKESFRFPSANRRLEHRSLMRGKLFPAGRCFI